MLTDLRQLLSGVARMKTIRPAAKILIWNNSNSNMTGIANKGEVLNYKKHINSSTSVKLILEAYFLPVSFAQPYFLWQRPGFCFLFSFLLRYRCSRFLTVKSTYLALLQRLLNLIIYSGREEACYPKSAAITQDTVPGYRASHAVGSPKTYQSTSI